MYYDFSSSNNYNQEFWKFDYLSNPTEDESQLGYHCGPGCTGEYDILSLNTYNSMYFIPSTLDEENNAYIYNGNIRFQFDKMQTVGMDENAETYYTRDIERPSSMKRHMKLFNDFQKNKYYIISREDANCLYI